MLEQRLQLPIIKQKTMTTIYATRDSQERYDSVRPEMVGKTIKQLRRQGWGNIRCLPVDNSKTAPNI